MWPKTRFTTLSNVKKSSIVALSSSITRTSDSGMLYRPRSRLMDQVCKGSSLEILNSLGSLRKRLGSRESSRKTHLTMMIFKMMAILQAISKSHRSRILSKSRLPFEGISESLKLQKKTPRTNQTSSVSIRLRTKGRITYPRPEDAPSTFSCTRMWKLGQRRKFTVDHRASSRIKAITPLMFLRKTP